MLSKKKLAAAGLIGLMVFNNFTPAHALSDTDAVSFDGVTISDFDQPDDGLVTVNSDRTVGKVLWSQFNVPNGQKIDFGFTQSGQTVINYVSPVFTKNPSLIAGQINTYNSDGEAANYGICGRVFLINPNGISLVTGQVNSVNFPTINEVQGCPSLVFSTLDLKTPFESINDTTDNLEFKTFVDGNGFANGIFTSGSDFINLKELSFLANGIGLTNGTRIRADINPPDCTSFNNHLNIITAGELTVGLDSSGSQLTPITIDAPNLVPACTFNEETEEFEDGGVRYYDFLPNSTSTPLPNLGSNFQIALCTDRYIVGNSASATNKGIIRVENQSDYFNSTGYKSVVKVATRLDANGAISVGNVNDKVVFLISKNPGQECTTVPANSPAHLLICAGGVGSANTNIFIDGGANQVQVSAVDPSPPPPRPTNRVVLDTSGEDPPANNVVLDTNDTGTPVDVANKPTGTVCAPGGPNCLGKCGTPPDPVPPTPPPNGGNGNGGDGGDGGDGAAIAIPLGVAGAGILGFLGVPALTATVPAAQSPYVAYTPATVYSCPVPMYAGAPGQTTGAAAGMQRSPYQYQYMQRSVMPMNRNVSPYYSYPQYSQPAGGAAPLIYPQRGSNMPINPYYSYSQYNSGAMVPVNQNVLPNHSYPQYRNTSVVTGQSSGVSKKEAEKRLNQNK